MGRRLIAKPALVKEYIDLFVNRRAYTLQSVRPHLESGRHYYYRPKEHGSGYPLLLSEKTVSEHLEGKLTIGLYAINPANQRCKWVAIDADYTNAMEDLIKLQYQLTQDRVESALEMSKRGGHLWIFLAVPPAGQKMPNLHLRPGAETGSARERRGFGRGNRGVPQTRCDSRGRVRQRHRRTIGNPRGANRRFWFYGAEYSLDAQMQFLRRLRRLTEEELDRFTAGKELPTKIAKARSAVELLNRHASGTSRRFCILDYVANPRIVGRDYVGRCPSCALIGRDRTGDNLAILISDPRFYHCWAGCSKEMIRAAAGRPIPARQTA
jgi:hypothetical protein